MAARKPATAAAETGSSKARPGNDHAAGGALWLDDVLTTIATLRDGTRQLPSSRTRSGAAAKVHQALADLAVALAAREALEADLASLATVVNVGTTLTDVLDRVYVGFKRHIPYDRIGVSLLEDEGRVVRSVWARSDLPTVLLGADYRGSMTGSSLQTIIDTGQPRILNDLPGYLREHPKSHSTSLVVKEGMAASLTCPLLAEGRPIGFLFFSSREVGAYRDAHVEIFQRLAGHLAIVLDKARSFERLRELNELKNRFLGIAAHDLRSPLALVKSYVELLSVEERDVVTLAGGQAGEVCFPQAVIAQRRNIYERLNSIGDRMFALINDLLDVSAIEAGKLDVNPVPTDLLAFLREAIMNNRPIAERKGIGVHLEAGEAVPPVPLDPRRIAQVIDNLIGNAVKFSHAGKAVSIKVAREGNAVRVAVRDQGQGIPEAELGRLFREFGKTSVRPTGGEKSTGLGLLIVKKIIEAHHGRIWVESKVGVGSTFTFELPLAFA